MNHYDTLGRDSDRDLFYEQARKINHQIEDRKTSVPCLTITHLGATIEVIFDRWVQDRAQYLYRIFGESGPDSEPIIFGDDIKGGSDAMVDPYSAFRTLLSFLLAWQEASEGGENYTIFDNDMRHALDWDLLLGDLSLIFQ